GRAKGEDCVLAARERRLPRRAVLGIAPEVAPGGAPHVPALDLGEAHLPVEAAVFAVGDHRQADRLLAAHHLGDRAALDRTKVLSGELLPGESLEGVLEIGGAQQASDVVDARRWHGLDDTIVPTIKLVTAPSTAAGTQRGVHETARTDHGDAARLSRGCAGQGRPRHERMDRIPAAEA